MPVLKISRLAAAGDVGVETVRYYQRRGLLEEPDRGSSGGMRRYDQSHVERLRFIRSAKSAGFTLGEIGALLRLQGSDDRSRVRALAQERIARLDERIAELTRAREALTRLARKCAAEGDGPCPILHAFEQG